jgi:CRP/FNR family transcriptional regulator, cyclic AMP receptor protein
VRLDEKTQHLAGLPLFAQLPARDLRRIAQLCTELIVEAGRVLCHEGHTGDEFFVVESGRFTVESHGRQLTTLGPGEFFGELALLDGGQRTATVRAETAGRVLVLDRREFGALLREEPVVAVRLLPGLAARMRRLAKASEAVGV